MRMILDGLMGAMRSLIWVSLLLLALIYCSAVFGVMHFHNVQNEFSDVLNFTSVPLAMFTMFTVAIGGEWQVIVDPIAKAHWWSPVFFIAFVSLASFGILNLMIGFIAQRTAEVALQYQKDEHDKREKGCKSKSQWIN